MADEFGFPNDSTPLVMSTIARRVPYKRIGIADRMAEATLAAVAGGGGGAMAGWGAGVAVDTDAVAPVSAGALGGLAAVAVSAEGVAVLEAVGEVPALIAAGSVCVGAAAGPV